MRARGRNYVHGTMYCYLHSGCRCQKCRAKSTLTRERQRINRSRYGPGRVDAAPLRPMVRRLIKAGMTYTSIGHEIGTTWRVPRAIAQGQEKVHRKNAERLIALYESSFTKDTRRWPCLPLYEYVMRKFTTPAVRDAIVGWERVSKFRYSTISSTHADTWAARFGAHPSEIWGEDWYNESTIAESVA